MREGRFFWRGWIEDGAITINADSLRGRRKKKKKNACPMGHTFLVHGWIGQKALGIFRSSDRKGRRKEDIRRPMRFRDVTSCRLLQRILS